MTLSTTAFKHLTIVSYIFSHSLSAFSWSFSYFDQILSRLTCSDSSSIAFSSTYSYSFSRSHSQSSYFSRSRLSDHSSKIVNVSHSRCESQNHQSIIFHKMNEWENRSNLHSRKDNANLFIIYKITLFFF